MLQVTSIIGGFLSTEQPHTSHLLMFVAIKQWGETWPTGYAGPSQNLVEPSRKLARTWNLAGTLLEAEEKRGCTLL